MPTLADVAKKANVSKMTVSRVINHPEQVTDELKELVFSAMAELDYRPNIAKQKHSFLIGHKSSNFSSLKRLIQQNRII
ncbi:LacI family transcriptional regulator [Enterococcus sp. DIV0802c]